MWHRFLLAWIAGGHGMLTSILPVRSRGYHLLPIVGLVRRAECRVGAGRQRSAAQLVLSQPKCDSVIPSCHAPVGRHRRVEIPARPPLLKGGWGDFDPHMPGVYRSMHGLFSLQRSEESGVVGGNPSPDSFYKLVD